MEDLSIASSDTAPALRLLPLETLSTRNEKNIVWVQKTPRKDHTSERKSGRRETAFKEG